jgi:hypothetical protein
MAVPARVWYAVTAFVCVMALIVLAKPAMMFTADGAPRRFGTHDPADDADADAARGAPTVFSFGVITVAVAAACAFLFTFLDLLATNASRRG